jgi:hypothetical protein
MASAQSIRVRHPITAEPFPQVLGLSDVKHVSGGIVHEINTGARWQLTEERASQSFDERLRIRKEKELRALH